MVFSKRVSFFYVLLAALACFFLAPGQPSLLYGDEQVRPAMDTDLGLWLGKLVVQRRGWVLDEKDPDNLVTEGYWELSEAACGEVISVNDDERTCEVSFRDREGWRRVELAVKRRLKMKANIDYYGNLFVEKWVEEGLSVDPDDHGKIIRSDGEIIVRYSLGLIGLRPPKKGDVVVRGPDWNPRRKVDGCRGKDGEQKCEGVVVENLNHEFYLRVHWLKSGMVESHRFDCRRFYDVIFAGDADAGHASE